MTASQTTDTSVQLPAKHGVSPEGLRPVTIRQLLDATRQHSDAPFQIGDIEVHRISLVAHVVFVRTSESLTIYDLEDGTSCGRISARQWTSDAYCDQLPDDCSKTYVHVVGHLDRKVELNGRNWVIAEHIHTVTDMPDRLFCHILETAFVTLSLQHGPPPKAALKSVGPRNATTPATTPVRRDVPTILSPSRVAESSQSQPALQARIRNSEPPTPSSSSRQRVPRTPAQEVVSATPIRQPALTRQSIPARIPSPSPPPSSPSPGPPSPPAPPTPPPPERPSKIAGKRRQPGIKRDPFADLTVLQRAILLQLMNAPPSEHGTDVTAIAMGVSHHDVNSSQVGAALDELVELGHIRATIDDSHYAVKTSHYPTSP